MKIDNADSFDRAMADLDACSKSWSDSGLDTNGCMSAIIVNMADCLVSNDSDDETVEIVLMRVLSAVRTFRGEDE